MFQDIVHYVAYLSLNKISFKTAQNYLAGISYFLKIQNRLDVTKSFVVSKMIEGMRRSAVSVDKRLPFTIPIMVRLMSSLPAICYSDYEAKLFSSAFALAFFGFFRLGEIVVSDKHHIDKVLQISDVTIDQSLHKLEVHLKYSKNDQCGKGTVISIPGSHNSPVCPVALLSQYVEIRPPVSGPLFVHFSGAHLTRYQFSALLKKVVQNCGLDPSMYTSHSFRIGAATLAFTQGFKEEEIKSMGRWKSSAYKSYIRLPLNCSSHLSV